MKKLLYTLLAVSIIFSACKKEEDEPNNSGNNNNSALAIGDFDQGGVIFYLDGNGGGLVCDIQDLSLVPWGCEGILISGSDGTTIGTGNQNTIDILAGCTGSTGQPFPGIAALECVNSTAQGYSDWFLPSKDELHEIYVNRDAINTTSLANGGNAFGTSGLNSVYWSSTENHLNSAFQQFFSGTGVSIGVLKSSPASVRAIRAF
tara:strand:+ start:768 stop:1379 length:612 start_codon:yes stop_codon:yes gene_type:complete